MKTRSVLECGGKRSATPLSYGKDGQPLFTAPRPKAVSPLRFATAVQKLARACIVLFCFILLPFDFSLGASGQSYSVDWYKIAGGGGTSTNGQFTVSGTIGQPEASATLTGGNYLLTGGFWSLFAMQTPGAPVLRIFLAGTNRVVLAWPASATGYVLQQNSNLAATNWTDVANPVGVVGSENQVVISPSAGNQFFRLH